MLSRTLIALAWAMLLSACARQDRQTITLSGSSTIAPLLVEIGKRFEAQHPWLPGCSRESLMACSCTMVRN